MKSLENQPWSKHFKVSEKDFERWQSKTPGDSFLFWSLKEKIVSTKDYLEWAVEHYQIPLLNDIFFEQYIMKKKEWKEVKELSSWTKEKIPVAVWNELVFIGCLEPSPYEKDFDFEYRFVLVSNFALEKMWNFTKSLSQSILREEEKTLSKLSLLKPSLKVSSAEVSLKPSPKVSPAEAPLKPVLKASPKEELLKPSFPKSSPVDLSLIQSKNLKTKSKVQASLPDPEEERVQDIDNKTFPGRTYEESNQFVMAQTKNKTTIKKAQSTSSLKLDRSYKEETSNSTLIIKQDNEYDKLWEQTKSLFCTNIILEVKDNRAYSVFTSGKVSLKEEDKNLVDMEDYSLFKVVRRGHPYHGFVVDTQANKTFFNKIGWDSFPPHVSAIPVKDESRQLKYIFVGLSIKALSKKSIQDVEKITSDFFQSKNKTKLKLAS